MTKTEKMVCAVCIALTIITMISCYLAFGFKNNDATQEEHRIELAKQDIVAEYGFEAVLWIDIEKVDNVEGRDDFYVFTCLTESDEIYLHRFAVTIREGNGEIDVDIWKIVENRD